jgi:hypothetical protein
MRRVSPCHSHRAAHLLQPDQLSPWASAEQSVTGGSGGGDPLRDTVDMLRLSLFRCTSCILWWRSITTVFLLNEKVDQQKTPIENVSEKEQLI